MRVAIVTTAGVTRQFRQWPEAILGRALVARGHKVAAFTILDSLRIELYQPWLGSTGSRQ